MEPLPTLGLGSCQLFDTNSSPTTLTDPPQGYLSFWNDNISYALRGCILIELALRRRIAIVKDPTRRRLPLAERYVGESLFANAFSNEILNRQVEVISDRQTGETILDEALRMIKGHQDGSADGTIPGEKLGVGSWVDLLSGRLLVALPCDSASLSSCRRNMECDENRFPIEASSGTPSKRSCRQRSSKNREAQLFIIRYGHPSSGGCCGMDSC